MKSPQTIHRCRDGCLPERRGSSCITRCARSRKSNQIETYPPSAAASKHLQTWPTRTSGSDTLILLLRASKNGERRLEGLIQECERDFAARRFIPRPKDGLGITKLAIKLVKLAIKLIKNGSVGVATSRLKSVDVEMGNLSSPDLMEQFRSKHRQTHSRSWDSLPGPNNVPNLSILHLSSVVQNPRRTDVVSRLASKGSFRAIFVSEIRQNDLTPRPKAAPQKNPKADLDTKNTLSPQMRRYKKLDST
jgi:hypothetical protein